MQYWADAPEDDVLWLQRDFVVDKANMQNARVGDILCFGTYEQDGNAQNGIFS